MPDDPRPAAKRRTLAGFAALGLCLLIAGWYGVKGSRTGVANAAPQKESNRSPQSKSADLTAGELIKAWLAGAGPKSASLDESAAITITSAASPARRKAFQQLLDGMNRGNAWELYEALAAADAGDGAGEPSDAEWTAFLRKWGSLDAGALQRVAGRPEIGWRAPSLLYGAASVDHAAALAWLEQMAPAGQFPEWRTAALRELVLGWTTTSFEEPAEWIRGHLDDPALDEVIAAYANGVAASDPETAFAWANAVEGDWRTHARECVAREWLAADPAMATAKLLEAGYRQEELDRIGADREGLDITISGAGADIHIGE